MLAIFCGQVLRIMGKESVWIWKGKKAVSSNLSHSDFLEVYK